MLLLQNYRKSYGSAPVLQVTQLHVPPGVYWLKGENGTGKTTLLKSIAGLIPYEGNIEVHGISLRRQRKQYTRIVSFAAAEPVYPSFLTGRELLQFYLQTKGGTPDASLQVAERLGIALHLQNKIGTYSSGMLKKLSLLLCFTGEPALVLLDEPFITLDANAVAVLREVISFQSDRKTSFLISSHQELAIKVPYQSLSIQQQTIKSEYHVASTG